jgi:hypothetical protein
MTLVQMVQPTMPPRLPQTTECLMYACIAHLMREAEDRKECGLETEKRVRDMIAREFPDVAVVRRFSIADVSECDEWSVLVRLPDGRHVTIAHD